MEILAQHQVKLSQCQLCPKMHGPPVFGFPNQSPVMLIGQAPGFKEIEVHKPFAWKAGKTLFNWFQSISIDEEAFRRLVYMAAVCRCYPGKKQKDGKILSGDRVPEKSEIEHCSQWLKAELEIIRPELIIPVGKLAISQIIRINKLDEVIGQSLPIDFYGHQCEMIALPHPSGVSTWTNTEPGKTLLKQALTRLQQHSAWQSLIKQAATL